MIATFHQSTLLLNPSNHAAVPPEGLVLLAGRPTEVPAEMADYLRGLGVEVQDAPDPLTTTPKPRAKGASQE